MIVTTGTKKSEYILEVSWGCPSEKYPLNGLFQWDQAKALKGMGEDVIFLALDMRSIRRWRRWGINHFVREDIPVYEYNFPYGPFSPEKKYKIQNHGFEKALRRINEKYGMPACVHFHGVMEAVSGMDYCIAHSVPYVITEHITPVHEGDNVHRRMTQAYSKADRIICVSSKLAKDIKEAYGADTDAVIPNIVDLDLFGYDDQSNKKGFQFVSAAGLNAGKGMDVLLRAFAGVIDSSDSKPHLTIMGDGDQRENLEKLSVNLGLSDYVEFTGTYVRPEFADRLSCADCFVLASRSETFGIVYIEAMAAGVPVIATRCGGPQDFVDDSNGILVPVDDVGALTEAMKNMMNSSAVYDRRMISGQCRERFSAKTVGERLQSEIRLVLCS